MVIDGRADGIATKHVTSDKVGEKSRFAHDGNRSKNRPSQAFALTFTPTRYTEYHYRSHRLYYLYPPDVYYIANQQPGLVKTLQIQITHGWSRPCIQCIETVFIQSIPYRSNGGYHSR